MKQFKRSERGQILVLMVVGLVALMGFAALAVDGSMVYSDRRYDQAAADASGLSGAGAVVRLLENSHVYYEDFKCNGVAAVGNSINAGVAAASTRASSNFFTLTNYGTGAIPPDKNGISWYCADNDWSPSNHADRYIDIKIQLVSETKTAFAHLIFGGPLKNTVQATVRVRPRSTDAFGYAIVSLSSQCNGTGENNGGVHFDGDGDIKVTNGGIFSSSCLSKRGTADIDVSPVPGTSIVYRTNFDENGSSGSMSPYPPRPSSSGLPTMDYETPDCNGMDSHGDFTGGGTETTPVTLQPGYFDKFRMTNGDNVKLSPGLYCINEGLVANGGKLTGDDVTIYVTGGNFDIGAQVDVNLKSPQIDPGPNHSIKGMLIRMPDNGSSSQDVYLRGGGTSSFMGLVYVPKAQIEVGGNSSNISTVSCQLIGNTVKIHGGVEININFDTKTTVSNPATLDLTK